MNKEDESKVFVLGVDGLDFRVLLPFLQQGKLPNFKELIKNGIARRLRSTTPPHSAPAWTSMVTGVTPEKHGLTFFHTLRDGKITPLSRLDRKYPAIWNLLSEKDLKSIVLNVPMTFPPEEINGILLSGTLQVPKGRNYIYPKDLQEKVVNSEYVLHPDDLHRARIHPKLFGKRLATVAWKRASLAFQFMEERNWDFFMLVLRTFDVLIHTIYPLFLDPTHPYFDKIAFKEFRKTFLDYCVALDKIVGQILKKLDEKTSLMIVSDHGCATIHQYLYLVPFLQKNGFLSMKDKAKAKPARSKTIEIVKEKLYDLLGRTHLLPTVWKMFYRFREATGRKLKLSKGRSYLSDFDLSNSQVIPYGHQTLLVRCNNAKTANKIVGKVRKVFSQIVDPVMEGKPITRIKEIKDPQTKGRGDYQVFLEMGRKYEINKLPRSIPFRKSFKGKHSRYGVFIGAGRSFQEENTQGKRFNCWDLPPTILKLFGREIPSWMDGDPLIKDGG